MICPNCLRDVKTFLDSKAIDGEASYRCLRCKEPVPLRYVRDYRKYEPLVFSLIGLPGHGKTVFFGSFLLELDNIGGKWKEFSYAPLDESGMRIIREKHKALKEGNLPEPTRKIFPKPAIVRLDKIPGERPLHLILFDIAGELFEDAAQLRYYAESIGRSPVVLWLLSPMDICGKDAEQFLAIYVQAMLEKGGNPEMQRLVIVLTKGDEVSGAADTPDEVKRFLLDEEGVDPEHISRTLEAWLGESREFHNFVRRAKEEFREVRYCIVSSLGSKPSGKTQNVSVNPRGVMQPLIWLLMLQRRQRVVVGTVINALGALASVLFIAGFFHPAFFFFCALTLPLLALAYGNRNHFCYPLSSGEPSDARDPLLPAGVKAQARAGSFEGPDLSKAPLPAEPVQLISPRRTFGVSLEESKDADDVAKGLIR